MTQALEMDESLRQVAGTWFSNWHFHLALEAACGQAARNVRFCMNKRYAIPLEKQASIDIQIHAAKPTM